MTQARPILLNLPGIVTVLLLHQRFVAATEIERRISDQLQINVKVERNINEGLDRLEGLPPKMVQIANQEVDLILVRKIKHHLQSLKVLVEVDTTVITNGKVTAEAEKEKEIVAVEGKIPKLNPIEAANGNTILGLPPHLAVAQPLHLLPEVLASPKVHQSIVVNLPFQPVPVKDHLVLLHCKRKLKKNWT